MIPYLRTIPRVLGVFAVTFLTQACGGDEPPPTTTETEGTIEVTVRADGSPKANVLVQRFAPGSGSSVQTVATNSSGVARFSGVEEGSWEMEVVVPGTFALADGEEGRKSVAVTAGQTATAQFDLTDVFAGETIDATGAPAFSPSTLTISAGTAVRWMNVSSVRHTVTPDGHTEWSAAELGGEGDTFTHTFNDPGTYEYYCEPHVGVGMTGTITVS